MGLTTLAGEVRHFGLANALRAHAGRALARKIHFRAMRAITIGRVNCDYLAIHPKYEHGFLDAPALRSFSGDPTYDLAEALVALDAGERCYAIVDGDTLASYGFYTRKPAVIAAGLTLEFDPRFVYMYKGFTHPRYRGRRLHAIGMTWALARWLSEGCAGLVSYVDANNLGSLRSCARMGYAEVGMMYAIAIGTRHVVYSDPGAERHGFRLVAGPTPTLTRGLGSCSP